MSERLIVIGAGMATGRTLEHLFEAGGDYCVTLFNAEPRGNYDRIMLSPVLAGEKRYEEIVIHDADWYAEHGVECRFGTRIVQVDRSAKTVATSDGEILAYDKLLIGTGSDPVMIPLPGHDLDGVIAYRDLEDTERMMAMGRDNKVVVIGGGLLGLEAAAGMATRGADVTVVHLMGHLMERQLDPAAGYLLRKALVDRGITVLCQANSKEILGADGHVRALRLEDGTELPCDLLVMAVGIRPNIALAQQAGLSVVRGIEVDDQMRSSDPDILAVGECIEHQGTIFGLVAPLYDQAQVAAKTLLGQPARYIRKETSTKLKVTGCDLFSAGDFSDGAGREEIVFSDPAQNVYRRLVIERDKLIGAVMYGDTRDCGWFLRMIADGTDVAEMRDTLIFGPDYQGGAPLDPLATAAVLPRERARRGCSKTPEQSHSPSLRRGGFEARRSGAGGFWTRDAA